MADYVGLSHSKAQETHHVPYGGHKTRNLAGRARLLTAAWPLRREPFFHAKDRVQTANCWTRTLERSQADIVAKCHILL